VADGFSVEVQEIRAHAAKIDALRQRFGAIKSASSAIAQDDAANGILCSWMAAILEHRHGRQNQLIAYVEENLALASEALIRTGQEYEGVDDAVANRIRRAGRV
jgi:hypothetical protein